MFIFTCNPFLVKFVYQKILRVKFYFIDLIDQTDVIWFVLVVALSPWYRCVNTCIYITWWSPCFAKQISTIKVEVSLFLWVAETFLFPSNNALALLSRYLQKTRFEVSFPLVTETFCVLGFLSSVAFFLLKFIIGLKFAFWFLSVLYLLLLQCYNYLWLWNRHCSFRFLELDVHYLYSYIFPFERITCILPLTPWFLWCNFLDWYLFICLFIYYNYFADRFPLLEICCRSKDIVELVWTISQRWRGNTMNFSWLWSLASHI